MYKCLQESTKTIDKSEVKTNIDYWIKDRVKYSAENNKWKLTEKERQILEDYFINKLKPREISSKYRVSRSEVYSIVEESKRLMIKFSKPSLITFKQPIFKNNDMWTMIEDYWKQKQHTCYTVNDVRSFLQHENPGKEVPSVSSIRIFMRDVLKLRYKRVSCRPYKVQTHESKQKRLEYIEFIRSWTNAGYIVVQIDELAINRSTRPTMAWIRQNDSSYVFQETQNVHFSCIAAVSSQSCE